MRVLVLGGTGAVGSQVVLRLNQAGHDVRYTGHGDLKADFCDPTWVHELEGLSIDALVHCAASVKHPWEVNHRAVVSATRCLSPARVVALTALLPGQTLPLPVEFAASWGALNAWIAAVAREIAPAWAIGVAVGPLETGLSERLPAELLRDFERFSALRRRGTAAEVAEAVCWLVCHNTWMTGRIVPINGGLS